MPHHISYLANGTKSWVSLSTPTWSSFPKDRNLDMEIVEAVQRLFVLPNYQFYSDPLGYDERFERWRGRASRPDRKRSNEPRAGTTSGSERERTER
jgi:hypothetical protein